ncbi:Helix-turn-helix [Paenibacillaceae bacterium GAS479]|nr:Helix-turn-helix [Paenibacillaceae bacterium GAS479]
MALQIGKCQLRSLRKSAGYTQTELCDALKEECGIEVTKAYISNLENNRGTPAGHLMLKALAIVLECSMDDFYTYKW